MKYIIVALKSEAQAFVDKYKLQKQKLGNFITFVNNEIMLIISGIGVTNSAMATQTLINNFDIIDEDIYLNIGICGASNNYSIGELIEVGNIIYKDKVVTLQNKSTHTLQCVDEEVSTNEYELVDMESFGFYDAVIHSPAIKEFHIFKVVSDHFQPQTITKELAKSLIFNAIDDINIILNQKVPS